MRPDESFIEQPVRSLQTMLRVIAEDVAAQPSVIPDGIYGPATHQAVTAFQLRRNLPATGITNQETWDAVVEDYEAALIRVGKAEPIEILMESGEVFRRGDSSPYIFLLQGMLAQLSTDYGSIGAPVLTGVLDDATTDSLAAFQALTVLDVTGELDKLTWKHLVKHFTLSAHRTDRRPLRNI